MHRHRKSASTGEKSSGSVGRHAERGGELEEDIRPETPEAVFNHAFPKPAPERMSFLNEPASWFHSVPIAPAANQTVEKTMSPSVVESRA